MSSTARLSSLAKNVRELRLHFCQTSPASQGLRDFVSKNYVSLKKTHPTLPILVREASGVEAKAYARFDKGVERQSVLSNLTEEQVADRLTQLTSSSSK
ncbi:thioredoxin-like protein [Piptocephalis cylindrospora]|uniref:Thioredoxin-like protein n=1 Tax=Piptocephalis cylindrospora TaxID=1907219 RepID=A0A4P9Y6N5_9FUNG|nr:thioredoxin-like protein [Piptocephalis cylindrospora]|eukprot:RKP14695.1 thioredoxin-like protein [Piptocephalis cylindrospora]